MIFDIEMQTTNKSDLPQRTRYYQAMMNLDNLGKGTKFTERSEDIDDLFLTDKTYNVFYNI